jgi:hypothetical protein
MPVINAANVIAVLLAVVFAGVGLLMVAAVKPMRDLAAEIHYSIRADRMIGALEVAAAAGLALGVISIGYLVALNWSV